MKELNRLRQVFGWTINPNSGGSEEFPAEGGETQEPAGELVS